MEISIKNTLKKLRHSKEVTQEQLAIHLGVTSQSVGKWERGEGFPDITMLPSIALYFGVTVDELLGIDKLRIAEKIEQYKKKVTNCAITERYMIILSFGKKHIVNFRKNIVYRKSI